MTRSFSKSSGQLLFFYALLALVVSVCALMIRPYAITLLTAIVSAILLAPLDRFFVSKFKHQALSSMLVVAFVFLFIFLPALGLIRLGIDQMSMAVSALGASGMESVPLNSLPLIRSLPDALQNEFAHVDVKQIEETFNSWMLMHVLDGLENASGLFLQLFIYFFGLFTLLLNQSAIYTFLVRLSPLADKTDQHLLHKTIATVRSIFSGILIYSFISGTIAVIGLSIFGIPLTFLLIVVSYLSALVPVVATALVLVPAVLYLFSLGMTAHATGLLIWTALSLGVVGNILSPYLIQGTTHINTFLILLGILGGISLFGPIGVIAGPTIVGVLLTLLELYQPGLIFAHIKTPRSS